MENEEIKIGIEKIQQIKMTSSEKESILKNVLSFSAPDVYPMKSPYTFHSFFSMIDRSHVMYYGMASFLILVLSGSGVAFASQKSLPGDTLYTFKVAIVEPINSSLKFSNESKAQYESSLATERLKEAEKLASMGKLDSEKEKQITKLLTLHTYAFDKAMTSLSEEDPNESLKTVAMAENFQNEMNSHAEKLDEINAINSIENAKVAQINSATSVMIGQENTNEIENDNTENIKISKFARMNGEKINIIYGKKDSEYAKKENDKKDSALTQKEDEKKSNENSSSGILTTTPNENVNSATMSAPIPAEKNKNEDEKENH